MLLAKKEALDSHLSPVFLLGELGSEDAWDVLRLFRYDYSDKSRCSQATLRTKVGCSLRSLLQPYRLRGRRTIVFQLRTERFVSHGTSYPVLLAFAGEVNAERSWLLVRYYEPFMANSYLEFPSHPEDLLVRWTDERVLLSERANDAPAFREVYGELPPIFNNPPGIYALTDAFRAGIWLSGNRAAPVVRGPSLESDRGHAVLSVTDATGRRVRDTTLWKSPAGLRRIEIRQHPLLLRHHWAEAFEMRETIEGQLVKKELFRPSGDLPYFTGGRTCVIQFHQSGDSEHCPLWVPSHLVVFSGQTKLFDALFTHVTYRRSSRGAPAVGQQPTVREARERLQQIYRAIENKTTNSLPGYYDLSELGEHVDPYVLRIRLKCNAYASVKDNDPELLADTLRLYRAVLAREGIDRRMYVYSVESLAQMAFEYVGTHEGLMVTNRFVRDAYRRSGVRELRDHLARLIDQYRWGFAMVLLQVVTERAGDNDTLKRRLTRAQAMLRDAICSPSHRATPDDTYRESLAKANRAIAAATTRETNKALPK